MPNNITGVGVIGSRDPQTGKLFLSPASTFSMAEDRNVEVIQGYSQTDCTSMKDLDAAEKASSVTITMGTGILDDEAWNWIIWNNRRQQSASIELPRLVNATVTDGAISISGLTTDQPNVSVIILNDTAPGNVALITQSSGTGITPASAEVGAGTITVDPVHNGKVAVVYYRQIETDFEMTGGNTNYQPYENVELFAKFCGTRFLPKRIWCPRVTSITGFSLDASSDEFSREFRAFLPPGWTQTYAEFTIA